MNTTTTPATIKLTLSVPVTLADALDNERDRMATELRTRLSINQIAVRVLRLGLDNSSAQPTD